MLDKVQKGLVFAPKHYLIFWLSNLLILSVSDEGYSRNGLCALNVIPTILLLSLGRYPAGGLFVSKGIIRLVVSVSALTWFIRYILLKFTVPK